MKKGFTLIELLAVIVILAIIAVIAVPIVLSIIDETKENASLRSVDNYMHALELEIANKGLNNQKYDDGVYSTEEFEIEIKGEKPTSGFIQIINGKVEKYSLIINNRQVDSKEEYDKWDGTLSEMIPDSEDNYHITKSSELAWLAKQVNEGNTYEGVNFYLENNLDLNNIEWTPIGTQEHPFGGNLYGNNNVIKNMSINKISQNFLGIFGYIEVKEEEQLINNLIIKDSKIYGKAGIGSCVGVSKQNSNLDNITSFNNELYGVDFSVSGIIGQTSGNLKNLKTISNVIKTDTRQAGGIVGNASGKDENNKAKIENCYVDSTTSIYSKGKIDAALGYNTSFTGGIVGTVKQYNMSNVISNATVIGEGSHVGGIAGQTRLINIENVSTGTNSYVEGTKLVGGIIGLLAEGANLNNAFSQGIIVYIEDNSVGLIAGIIESGASANGDSDAILKQK